MQIANCVGYSVICIVIQPDLLVADRERADEGREIGDAEKERWSRESEIKECYVCERTLFIYT